MNKKYRPQGKRKYLCFLLLTLPVIYLLFTNAPGTGFYFSVATFFLTAINGYLYFNRVFAEIKDNILHFYRGVGFHDKKLIKLKEIQNVDRRSKQLLAITSITGHEFSFEADKSVLDPLETDLKQLINYQP